jgi:superfamily II DNA or RNA helicase
MSTAIASLTNLRDYQRDALAASRAAFDRGVWSQMMVSAVGSGKTVIFAHLRHAYADWLAQFAPLQQKVLVLAHRDRLIDQAVAKIREYNPDLRVGVEMAARRYAPMDDVVVASVQTLTAGAGHRLARLNVDDFRIVVVDEAHRTAASTYQRVLRHFGLVPPHELHAGVVAESPLAAEARTRVRGWWSANWPNRLLMGVTATPDRSDAVGLEWTYREVVFDRDLRWYIDRGYLAPIRGVLVKTDVSVDSVKRIAGDFAQAQLARLINTPARNGIVVRGWQQAAADRRASLFFCADVAHARDLAATFRQAGVAADSIAGEDDDRAARLAEFERGDLQVLTNCQLLTEGVDIPAIDCVGMASPTQSRIRYMQAVGRGTRLAPGKADLLVLDYCDDARKYAIHTAGDIFGLPPRFNGQGTDLLASAKAIEAAQERMALTVDLDDLTPETLAVTLQTIDLVALPPSPTAEAHGRLTWAELTPGRYTLQVPPLAPSGALESAGHALPETVVIEPGLLGDYEARVVVGGQVTEMLGGGLGVAEAFRRAERWVELHRPHAWAMKQRAARWREREASDKQIGALRKAGYRVPAEGLTRGQASDLLDAFYARRRRA